jgi:hypothetical protein
MPISEHDRAVARSSTTSDVFNAIADTRRREVLDALIAGEKAAGGWRRSRPWNCARLTGVTKLTHTLAFRDKAGRDHMTGTDGLEANYDNVEGLLKSLLDPNGTVSA